MEVEDIVPFFKGDSLSSFVRYSHLVTHNWKGLFNEQIMSPAKVSNSPNGQNGDLSMLTRYPALQVAVADKVGLYTCNIRTILYLLPRCLTSLKKVLPATNFKTTFPKQLKHFVRNHVLIE